MKLTVRVILFKKPSQPVSGHAKAVLVMTRNSYLAYSLGIFVMMTYARMLFQSLLLHFSNSDLEDILSHKQKLKEKTAKYNCVFALYVHLRTLLTLMKVMRKESPSFGCSLVRSPQVTLSLASSSYTNPLSFTITMNLPCCLPLLFLPGNSIFNTICSIYPLSLLCTGHF